MESRGTASRLVGAFSLTAGMGLVLASGLFGLPENGHLQALWPAVGAAAGLAARVRAGRVPAVASGLVVTAVLVLGAAGWPWLLLAATGTLVTAAALAVAAILRELDAVPLRRPRDLASLLLAAGVVGLISCLPALGLDRATSGAYPGFEPLGWMIGLAWGVVAITPLVLTAQRPTFSWPWRRVLELAGAVALTAAAAVYNFSVVVPGRPGLFGWPYLVIVGLVLLAVRFGVRALAPVVAVVAWYAAAQSLTGSGAFVAGGTEPISWLMVVQLFTVVIAITVLLVALLTDDRARALAEAQRTSQVVRQVLDASQSQIHAKEYGDAEGRYILTNRSWNRATGVTGAAEGASDTELFGAEIARERRRTDAAVMAANAAVTSEQPEGDGRLLLTTQFPLRGDDGSPWGVGGIATDVTMLARAQEVQRRQADRLAAVFTVSPTPTLRIAATADGLRVQDVNDAWLRLTDYPRDAVPADLLAAIVPEDRETVRSAVAAACQLGPPTGTLPQHEIRLQVADGRHQWALFSAAAVGEALAAERELVLQFTDIGDRKDAERALAEMAMTDALTGLPNRYALLSRLRAALDRLRRHPGTVCVLFCDLDQFKNVNDTLGHQVGDELLLAVARRIRSATRGDDTVARLGGDEFVVVYEGLPRPMDAVLLAMRLQEAIRVPWEHGDQVFRPTMSIGVATTSDADASIDDLLRRADMAMYRAKEGGRDRVQLYDRSLDRTMQRTVAMQQRLRAAVDSDDLILHYQPIVDLRTGDVVGSEALLRLRGTRGRIIPPGEFIPYAETSGLIGPVGAWVLQRALRDLRARQERGRRQSVSINVSPAQLHRPEFGELLLDQTARHRVDPDCVILEITETALVHDSAYVAKILSLLHDQGVSIALDDFGTGYSSLSWLTQFPVDLVKIDRSFIARLGIDNRRTAVVAALIAVAAELGLTVIAEGVETPEQRKHLVDLECPLAQGYLLGRPVPAEDPSWA